MVYRTFAELISAAKGTPRTARMAVAAAGDAHTLEAVLRARREGIVIPILVGDSGEISAVLTAL
ncbi:MAG: phosphate butyryltransferase, partial [Pseudoflavonifractor sp.]